MRPCCLALVLIYVLSAAVSGCGVSYQVHRVTEQGLEFVGSNAEVDGKYTIQLYEGERLHRDKVASVTSTRDWAGHVFGWISAIDNKRFFTNVYDAGPRVIVDSFTPEGWLVGQLVRVAGEEDYHEPSGYYELGRVGPFGHPTVELLPGRHEIRYSGRVRRLGLFNTMHVLNLKPGHRYVAGAYRGTKGYFRTVGAIYLADETTGEVLDCVGRGKHTYGDYLTSYSSEEICEDVKTWR